MTKFNGMLNSFYTLETRLDHDALGTDERNKGKDFSLLCHIRSFIGSRSSILTSEVVDSILSTTLSRR